MEEMKDVGTVKAEETELKTEDKQSLEDLHGENLTDRVKVLSPTQMVLKRFFRSKLSIVGLVVLVALFLFSFVGPVLSPWYKDGELIADETRTVGEASATPIEYEIDGEKYIAYVVTVPVKKINSHGAVSWQHWMGTDEFAYDLLTKLMLGGRISLTIGFVVIILETLLGVVLGGLAGYFGKWVDQVVMRIVDILYCIPQIPILLIVSVALESFVESGKITSDMKLYFLMGFLTLIGWAGTARLVRGQILSLREQEFMLAAKCSGLSTYRKIFKHLVPNVMPQLIVSMTLGLGSIILTEATLGFLGLLPFSTSTWGKMINYATQSTYLANYPNFWVPPGICITLAILAFNFVGDGLRDAFDPKMKR